MPHSRLPIPLLCLCLASILSSCAEVPDRVSVECRSWPESGESGVDTLAISVHVERAGHRREPPRLLVRVDPLTEPGAVLFKEGTPATAAAAAIALTASGGFEGCISSAPSKFELRASAAPRGRVWLRVSSNVPVAATLTTGDDPNGGSRTDALVVVSPGGSGQTAAAVGM